MMKVTYQVTGGGWVISSTVLRQVGALQPASGRIKSKSDPLPPDSWHLASTPRCPGAPTVEEKPKVKSGDTGRKGRLFRGRELLLTAGSGGGSGIGV